MHKNKDGKYIWPERTYETTLKHKITKLSSTKGTLRPIETITKRISKIISAQNTNNLDRKSETAKDESGI
jgi:hypothetical protein